MVMITAMTAAKIGRVMKKRDRRMIPVPRRKRRKVGIFLLRSCRA
jgi:hypothetical protein